MRIQKALAAAGVASRRKIEAMIIDGQVYVNSQAAKIGQALEPGDKVTVAGKVIDWQCNLDHKTIIYHKPEGEVCTRDDPQGRPTVFAALPSLESGRWISVGRLDINTSGLLLFTTDGELANKLMHPSNEYVREYKVRVYGRVSEQALDNLTHGVELDDGFAKFDTLNWQGSSNSSGSNSWFTVSLHSGRNRLVRRLFESQGLQVNRLLRSRFAHYKLPSNLDVGEIKFT
jgi:23S rRNA pseudouridine2605 synthase